MSLRPVSAKCKEREADLSLLENVSYSTASIDGRDSIRLSDGETESLAETSEVALATPIYSKRPSGKFEFYHFSSV